jgi:hypothetical protein
MKAGVVALALALVAPAIAHAERVVVKIVDIAGGVAYVEPGTAAGVVVGTKIKFGPIERTVVVSSTATASFALDGLVVSIGQSASAEVAPGGAATTAKLAPVHPADAFREQWEPAVPPAQTQTVKTVPLGSGSEGGAVHVTVLGHGYASVGRDATAAETEARVITSFDLLQDRPFAADGDLAVRAFGDGYNQHERTPVFVRAAQLRYGDAVDPNLALGRLRWAASSVGMLDGGRAMAHVGAFELAAFGGLVPDPVSGKPDTSTSRFGGEAIYDLSTVAWQPRVALTAVGSTWQGQIDERRLALSVDANHGGVSLDGWAEGQAFSPNNPWGAHAVELTGAGVTAGWRDRSDHVGLDLSFLRPERSLRLAAALPPDWLCTQVPEAGVVGESCRGGDYWTTASVTAGLRRGRFVVDAIGSVGQTHAVTSSYTSSGYIRGEVHFDRQRLVVGGSLGHAEFATWDAAEVGIGSELGRRFDAEVRYRAELLDYVAATKASLLHTIAFDTRYLRSTAFDLGLSLLGTTGEDRRDLAALVTIVWRPLP